MNNRYRSCPLTIGESMSFDGTGQRAVRLTRASSALNRAQVWLVVSLALTLTLIGGIPAGEATQEFAPGAVQAGQASWYGKPHDGHRTASGEVYDMYRLSAAHPELPLGSRVRVTNLNNGRSVDVRVNDRGPVIAGRIIDLSYAAAQRLGALRDGTVPVSLRVLSTPRRVLARQSRETGRSAS
jgi:3D (Asp-Asp-Asp) domain-containing protein